MTALIEIERLSKRFGPIVAVDEVSFAVPRGEVLGFLGPNGAGKSTTMKMITGFLAPDAGSVRIGGDDIAEKPLAAKRRFGYLPEGAPLYADMTPRAFLSFAAEVRGLCGAEHKRRFDEAVASTHLENVLEQPIGTLSKGFKRRVGLAQAILHDPEVLVLDEPTDGLDPNQKHDVRALIRAMAPDKAIILSTHILEEVEAVCTRAIVINRGRVVADGTPGELMARSSRHLAVLLAVRRDGAADVAAVFEGHPDVRLVEEQSGDADTRRYLISPKPGCAVVALVGRLARERAWPVEELHVERGRLDEVFRSLTGGPQ
jgi:ABC-2 type transport system ATP-binding protein